MRSLCFAMRFLLLPAVLLGIPCVAANPTGDAQALYAVVHVDIDAKSTAAGVALLQRYAQNCRKDSGNLSFQLLQEQGRPNHLTLVEGWRDGIAYDSHIQSPYAKRFRAEIQPMLGSPFDERLHHEIAP